MAHCFKVDFKDSTTENITSFSLYGSSFKACQAACLYTKVDTKGGDVIRVGSKKVLKEGFETFGLRELVATVTYVEIF